MEWVKERAFEFADPKDGTPKRWTQRLRSDGKAFFVIRSLDKDLVQREDRERCVFTRLLNDENDMPSLSEDEWDTSFERDMEKLKGKEVVDAR